MVRSRARVTEKGAGEKLARPRLSVLELAQALGSVSAACRRRGMDRTGFYAWKRRFQTHGFAGLKDLPPIARSHPLTTPPEVVARLEELALAHPAYGCFVGTFKRVAKVYLHAVVDTFGSSAFGFLHVTKQPEAAVAVLHNDVLPFYRDLDLEVGAILTDNGREFCGTENHPYELYLDLNGIEHRRTRVHLPKTNGFVERFNGTVLEEFFRPALRERFYDGVEALQADPDAWLAR